MAHNRTGNATAVTAPDTGAGPGKAVIQSIPDGTDAPTIESVTQAIGVTSDHVTYYAKLINGQLPSTALDTPQYLFKDSAGNNRFGFDHLGYPINNAALLLKEDWIGTTGGSISANTSPLTGFQKWAVTFASTGGTIQSQAATVLYPTPMMLLQLGNTNTSTSTLGTSTSTFFFTDDHMIALNIDLYLHAFAGAWSVTAGLNLSNGGLVTVSASNAAADWKFNTSTSGAGSNIQTAGVNWANDTVIRFRLELHGTNSPYGLSARCYVNGGAVITSAINIPSRNFVGSPTIALASTDTTASRQVFVGGVGHVVNRALSVVDR